MAVVRVPTRTSIPAQYVALVRQYAAERSESALLDTYSLGREAVLHEFGLLEISEMHYRALTGLLPSAGGGLSDDAVKAASTVLSEFLSPFEMHIRGYREANVAMRHVNETLEDEIKRIAHDIHDGAGQYLACAHMALYKIAKDGGPQARASLNEARAVLDELERHLRQVSHELRPRVLEESGIEGAIEFLAAPFRERTGIDLHVEIELERRPPATVEAALYRCVQELFNNIGRHSCARRAWLHLTDAGEWIVCEVRDDGVGFDSGRTFVQRGGHHLGLIGIRERVSVFGGDVEIQSSPGIGARFRLRIPK